jgi:hypothetical protein
VITNLRIRVGLLIAGTVILATAACLMAATGCGDDWPRAVDVPVTVGGDGTGEACAAFDGGAPELVACDGGGQ